MMKLITDASQALFPGGRLLKLLKNGMNITNSTSPLMLTKNITMTVIDCCAPPPIRLAAHCIGAGAAIVASVTYPHPITIGSAVHMVNELYDRC